MKKFILQHYGGLSRPVYVLFIARIVNRMGDFVKLFLTLYLTQVLELPAVEAGTFVMLAAGASMLGGLISGNLTDIFGRRKLILGLQATSAVLIGSCGFLAPSMLIVWLLIIAAGAMGAVRPVVNSIVADLTSSEKRQRAFSLLYLGTNIGVAIGPMIAGFLFHHFLKWIFWGDAISTLISLSLVFIWVPESKPSDQEMAESMEGEEHLERAEQGSFYSVLLKRPVLLLFAPLAILSNFIYSQHAFAIPLHLSELWGKSGAEMFGTVMSVNAVVVLASTALVLHFFGRFEPLKNMGFAGLFFLTGFGMLHWAGSFPYFLFSTFLWTIGEIIMVTNVSVFIANHSPISHRGRFNGMLSLLFGLGFTVGPYVSGLLIDVIGVLRLWLIIGLTAGLDAMLFFLLDRFEMKKVQRMAEKI